MIAPQRLALMIGEKLREIATRQGHVPFDRGDLRKAHVVQPFGAHGAILAVNTPYARAVHDGRPQITIRPKSRKALVWTSGGVTMGARHVTQPARKARPWLRLATYQLQREGLGFLAPEIGQDVAEDLSRAFRRRGFDVERPR
jgi:hypothetical protein